MGARLDRSQSIVVAAVVAALLGVFLAVPAGRSQTHPPRGPQPAQPPLPQQLRPAAGPPAAPDTLALQLRGDEGWPVPEALHLSPDSLLLGQIALLAVDFPEEPVDFVVDSLHWEGDWIEEVADKPGAGGLAGWWARLSARDEGNAGTVKQLPPADGWRVVVPFRVYRLGPMRVAWAGQQGPVSGVLQVKGRAAGTDQTAAVRDPRPLGWRIGLFLAALVVLALVLGLIWWSWRRRRRDEAGPEDLPLPPPAYLSTAVALWELEQENLPARGEGQLFLDRLARLLRVYLAARFRIHAAELTTDEVVPVAQRHGYRAEKLAPFAAVLARADSRRFSPTPTTAEQCRGLLAKVVALIDATRVTTTVVAVEPALQLAGDQAWVSLRQRYAAGTANSGGGD